MVYFKLTIYIFLIVKFYDVASITTRTGQNQYHLRNVRRHTDSVHPTDWELGLREAIHQALLREHNVNPSLRDELFAAPLIGRQDTASPFGDVAVLARGQLYATDHGYKLIQEPSDCDDCHLNRCERIECHPWKNLDIQNLLALWTVKRIRHRDSRYGHVFELEYTIAPITSAIDKDLILHGGFFNYNVPGHIFVVKTEPPMNSLNFINKNTNQHVQLTGNKWYKNQASGQHFGNDQIYHNNEKEQSYFKPGVLIGVSPGGHKHVLHSFPGLFSSYHPQVQNNAETTIDPKEYELYKKLIESLASKATTAQKTHSEGPQKFALGTSTSPQVITSATTLTLKPFSQQTPTLPTAYIQFQATPNLQFPHSILTTTTEYETLTSPITSTFYYPTTTISVKGSKLTSTQMHPNKIYTSEFKTTLPVPLPTPPKPIQTTIHYYYAHEEPQKPQTTTQLSYKTTINKKTTTTKPTPLVEEDYDLFPVINHTQPMTSMAISPKKPTTQEPKKTIQTIAEEDYEGVDLFSDNPVNEYVSPMTLTSKITSSDLINNQLPPPDKNTETTIPYLTITKPYFNKTEVTESTVLGNTEGKEYTHTFTTPTLTVKEMSTTKSRKPTSENPTTRTDAVFTESPTSTQIRETTVQLIPATYQDITSAPFVPNKFGQNATSTYEYSFNSTGLQTSPQSITEIATTDSSTIKTSEISTISDSSSPSFTTHFYTLNETQPTTTMAYFISTEKNEPFKDYQNTMIETSTKKYTKKKKTKPSKIYSTTPTIFLSTGGARGTIDTYKNIDDDDIFGRAPTIATTQSTTSTTKQEVTESDLAEALFGGRRSKQIKVTSKLPITTINIPKIIYSNFYTIPPEDQMTTFTDVTKGTIFETTTLMSTPKFKPSTDQSYSTSISFQVNKRRGKARNTVNPETSLNLQVPEVINRNRDYKVERPNKNFYITTSTDFPMAKTKKVFDEFALQLINHARSIDYLNNKKKTIKSKYKRRNSALKSRRSQRKNKSSSIS